MKELFIEIEGHRVKVTAQKIGQQTWVHYEGKTLIVEPRVKSSRSGKTLNADPTGEIRAPMPGKVIKIYKGTGDIVSEHEAIVVLEAMKMEYSLKSNIKGTVLKIHCQEGDLVSKDQCLVNIDELK